MADTMCGEVTVQFVVSWYEIQGISVERNRFVVHIFVWVESL